jgi:predicted signal transduction protein with EAL and GGDEF domain
MMPSQTLHLVDALTGAYSRATLNERFKEEVERAHRYHRPLSLLFMDIDHFKSVNDGFGHIRGLPGAWWKISAAATRSTVSAEMSLSFCCQKRI